MAENALHARSGLFFQLTCWVLGLIAFTQLLIGGVALALRVEAAREVRIEEKIVTKIVNIAPKPSPLPPAKPLVALPPAPDPISPTRELPSPRPLSAPPIADPVIERLVNEARTARVADDLGSSYLKLEEAVGRDPDEPSALYELGLVYEALAAADPDQIPKAAEAFQKVFNLGTKAGALYPLAAKKLEEGIALPQNMRGKLSIGRVLTFPDNTYPDGERVILTIPVSAAPGSEPTGDEFFIKVTFFDKDTQGTLLPKGYQSQDSYEWVSGDLDWLGGQETLRVTYTIPTPSASDIQLFGRRKYYGQVVELFYKNEVVDAQATPRHLATELNRQQGVQETEDPLLFNPDGLPDFDPNLPLLPPLDGEIPVDPMGELPPFDER
ncbi:hypothetical protein HNR46_001887 [Haloferula luteola]|uniref:Tetratricopeptide repeat protein n=1 Tax=Haloferula luteola TaxID=595692 RepID=A0A840VAE1_9BACT|nr:hypothetical protein [Haloferula luteola]MBB5351648.1 hypothetical protein [Haloferula luteola]